MRTTATALVLTAAVSVAGCALPQQQVIARTPADHCANIAVAQIPFHARGISSYMASMTDRENVRNAVRSMVQSGVSCEDALRMVQGNRETLLVR